MKYSLVFVSIIFSLIIIARNAECRSPAVLPGYEIGIDQFNNVEDPQKNAKGFNFDNSNKETKSISDDSLTFEEAMLKYSGQKESVHSTGEYIFFAIILAIPAIIILALVTLYRRPTLNANKVIDNIIHFQTFLSSSKKSKNKQAHSHDNDDNDKFSKAS